jgi:hypothetical protein
MYLKATTQKVTGFGYFAYFGQEQTFEQSNWDFGTADMFSYYYSIFFFYRIFLS